MDRLTFVMGAAAIGAAALTGGMLGVCAGGEGAEPAVGSAPVEPSPMLEPAPASSSEPQPYDSVFPRTTLWPRRGRKAGARGLGARRGGRDLGRSGYWWQREHFDEDAVRRMVDDGVAAAAARTMRRPDGACCSRRTTRAPGAGGYRAGQRIAVKANMNGAGTFGADEDSAMSYTSRFFACAAAVARGGRGRSGGRHRGVRRVPHLPGAYDGALLGGRLPACASATTTRAARTARRRRGAPVVWSADVAGAATWCPPACRRPTT
ncbi:MAG: hypothetical protein ACLSVD_05890 [Eggerthellaceae bacterium]